MRLTNWRLCQSGQERIQHARASYGRALLAGDSRNLAVELSVRQPLAELLNRQQFPPRVVEVWDADAVLLPAGGDSGFQFGSDLVDRRVVAPPQQVRQSRIPAVSI